MHMRPLITTLLFTAAITACSSAPRSVPRLPDRPAADFSVYDVGGDWRDQTGAVAPLAGLRGQPRVIAMIYTHCSAACPIALANMKRIESEVPGVRFVLVSIDPERDTPGALAMFARQHELSGKRWTLLNGNDDDVRALAAVLGIRYRRISAGALAHSNALTLVDASGAIIHQQLGFDGTSATIRAARSLPTQPEVTH